jgi:hypothetical protein
MAQRVKKNCFDCFGLIVSEDGRTAKCGLGLPVAIQPCADPQCNHLAVVPTVPCAKPRYRAAYLKEAIRISEMLETEGSELST